MGLTHAHFYLVDKAWVRWRWGLTEKKKLIDEVLLVIDSYGTV
jgi:hypothetical protein